MKMILVVDDMAIFRDAIAAALQSAGFRTAVASDGEEALRQIRAHKPDLILLDIGMPVMDGLSVAAALRGDPATRELPIILLTALSEREKVLQAGQLGIHDYLLKSRFSLADLIDRVRRRLRGATCGGSSGTGKAAAAGLGPENSASPRPGHSTILCASGGGGGPNSAAAAVGSGAGEIPRLLTRQLSIARVAKAMEGKTLGGVVAQVLALALSPRMDTTQLAVLISRDPALSAKVLRAANSAMYLSRGGAKTTVGEAVRTIGAGTVRNLAAAMGIFEAMPETAPDGYNPIRCWQHSFAVARLCEHFASYSQPENAGVAYLVGLCHDLVEVVFHAQFGTEYAQVLDWETRTGKTRIELEKVMLGVERAELVGIILRQIGLPEAIQRPINAYHNNGVGLRGDGSAPMVRVLQLADSYANGVQLASGPRALVSSFTNDECRDAVGHDQPQPPGADELRNEVFTLTAMLARLSAKEEAELMAPLYPRSERRVCLVREPPIFRCDPLEQAIRSMAQVTLVDQVPPVEQLREFQCLVVETCGSSAPGLGSRELASIKLQAAASGLEVIWLVRRMIAPVMIPGVSVLTWPVTLENLAAALGAAGTQPQAQAA